MNGASALVTEDAEMAALLNAFFASDFMAKTRSQESQTLEVIDKVWRMKTHQWPLRTTSASAQTEHTQIQWP